MLAPLLLLILREWQLKTPSYDLIFFLIFLFYSYLFSLAMCLTALEVEYILSVRLIVNISDN